VFEGGHYEAYLEGRRLTDKDGIAALHRAVELGQRDAGGELGHFYIWGLHTKQDIAKAFEVLTYATLHNGDGNAAFNLASLYERGQGVEKDLVQALALYRLAGKLSPGSGMGLTGALLSPEMTDAQKNEANVRRDAMFREISARLARREDPMKERLAAALPQIKREIDERFPWLKMTLVPYSVRQKEAAQ
jgi:TPR repeat protein